MSIIGIGVDSIAIERIKRTRERFGQQFLNRVYTKNEYTLAQLKGTDRRLAMFFAAKEAVSKALGTGFIGFGMKDIEVKYLASGKPEVRLHAGATLRANQMGILHVHLSLTDDDGTATAFVIGES